MQVRELVAVAQFFRDFVQREQLVQRYQELIAAINEAAANQNPQNVQSRLDALLDLHRKAEARVMSPAQRHLMAEYGVTGLLGDDAIERLDRAFLEHRAHPQGLVNAVQAMLNETTQLAKKANQLVGALEPLLATTEPPEIGESEGRLWLQFADAVSVDSIADLEQAAERWKQILHHFSRVPGGDAQPGRILQLHKYSPLEMELAAAAKVLVPLGLGIQFVLSKIGHVIKILQEVERLRELKISNKKIAKELEKEAEEERKRITTEAADEVQSHFATDAEARNAIEQGLKQVLKFIEGGGLLDIDVDKGADEGETADNSEADTRVTLRAIITSMRKDMKLLAATAAKGEGKSEGDGS